MQLVDTTLRDWELVVPNPRGGDVFRKVIRGAEGGKRVSYDVRLERFGVGERGYSSIRHRHDFEQLRFAFSGRMDLGFDTLEEGDVGYFPANTYYGPQACAGAVVLIAQWGDRFITREQNDSAIAQLSARGEFYEGVYRSINDFGIPFNKDPLNAIWEQVFGEPYVPQAPRYRHPILMTPSAFGWSRPEGSVRSRRLGSFTELGLALEVLQWVEDGPLEIKAGDDRRPTFLFTTRGTFVHNGESFAELSGVWADPGEDVKLGAAVGSEALLVRFPEPSSRITLGAGAAK